MVGLAVGLALASRVIYFHVDARPKSMFQQIELESHFVDSNRWGLELSDNDIEWIYRIVEHEAGNQKADGKRAVAEVVLNRVYSNKFPNTVEGVLFSPGQFCSREELEKMNPSESTQEVVNQVIWGEGDYVLSMHALYFKNTPKGSKDEVKIGDHYFRRKY